MRYGRFYDCTTEKFGDIDRKNNDSAGLRLIDLSLMTRGVLDAYRQMKGAVFRTAEEKRRGAGE